MTSYTLWMINFDDFSTECYTDTDKYLCVGYVFWWQEYIIINLNVFVSVWVSYVLFQTEWTLQYFLI